MSFIMHLIRLIIVFFYPPPYKLLDIVQKSEIEFTFFRCFYYLDF